jgi:hypothetical protein
MKAVKTLSYLEQVVDSVFWMISQRIQQEQKHVTGSLNASALSKAPLIS